jgi:hypothetical protein
MKLLFTCMLCILTFLAKADNFISGNMSVTPGATETYTADWPSWGSVYENYANVTWTVGYGTILSSDKHTVTIQWDNIPAWLNATGTIEVYEDLGAQTGYAYIDIVNFITGTIETCSGVLGAPAIFVDFGTGFNPGPPLPAGSITYPYNPSCGLQPGEYTISNSTVGCHGQWLVLPQDHTPGDVNGYMLMVDGDDNSGEVYRATVTGLTQAFGYEFSVYIANLSDQNIYERPKLQFEIYDLLNNQIQESGFYTIDYDPSDPWKKVSFMFDLPPGVTSIQVVLKNDHNDEYGNDFAVDDISFAPCYPPILASFSNSTIVDKSYICNNGTVNLYSRWPTPTIPYINPGFKWQKNTNGGTWTDIPGATTINFVQTENLAGIFQYRMYAYETSNPSQYVVSNAITYFVQKMVVNAKTYSVFSCNQVAVQLVPNYELLYRDPNGPALNYTFNWAPGSYLSSTNIESPLISLPPLTPPNINSPTPPPPLNYTYNLSIQNTNFGCVASNTQTVLHYNPRRVAVPTAFTPGATTNNLFRPINLQDYPGGEFWVWDRWGNLIFHSTGPTLLDYSWNGRYSNGQPCETGNYVWRVAIPGCPNNILNGAGGSQATNPFGNVLLIR